MHTVVYIWIPSRQSYVLVVSAFGLDFFFGRQAEVWASRFSLKLGLVESGHASGPQSPKTKGLHERCFTGSVGLCGDSQFSGYQGHTGEGHRALNRDYNMAPPNHVPCIYYMSFCWLIGWSYFARQLRPAVIWR